MKTTRKELFDLVWEFPMTHLAKRFKCSDVGLRKVCVKNNIPLPESGHWMKKQYNKAAQKPPLPDTNFNPEIMMDDRAISIARKATSRIKELKASITEESLKPSESLENPHPMVKATLKVFANYQKRIDKAKNRKGYWSYGHDDWPPFQDKGRYSFHPSDGALPIISSLDMVPRILKLIDPILKKLSKSGFKLYTSNEAQKYEQKFLIEKDNESITISIRQGYSWQIVTPEERKALDIYGDKRAVPNQNLTFDVIGFNPREAVGFKNSKTKTIEDQLDIILKTILDMPKLLKEKRDENTRREAEWKRVSSINNHNYKITESQREQIDIALKESKFFEEINQLKNYLNLVENSISTLNESQFKIATQWIDIVKTSIDKNNPLIRRVRYFENLDPTRESYSDEYWYKNLKSL